MNSNDRPQNGHECVMDQDSSMCHGPRLTFSMSSNPKSSAAAESCEGRTTTGVAGVQLTQYPVLQCTMSKQTLLMLKVCYPYMNMHCLTTLPVIVLTLKSDKTLSKLHFDHNNPASQWVLQDHCWTSALRSSLPCKHVPFLTQF